MLTRLRRIVLVFATTVAAYLVYALMVVPWLEPSFQRTVRGRPAASPPARTRRLDEYFPPGSWELQRPKVIETDEGMLLFDDYQPLPDGQLKLTRCTVVGYLDKSGPASDGSTEGPLRRPVVLRAPQGATLTFDRSLDILRGQFGRLIGGRLNGDVEITSPPSGPDRQDDIRIVTRHVQLEAQRIWTPHEVQFRYGGHAGQGRGLTIMLRGAAKSSGEKSNLGVGGLQLLELERLERLQLQMNDGGLFGRNTSTVARGPSAAQVPTQPTTVDVKCQGPCRFDFEKQLLTLEDQVDLMRHHRSGLSDQLTCERLEVHFAPPASPDGSDVSPKRQDRPPLPAGPGKLTPVRVIARGYPVIIRAASVGVGTEAEHVEYDCILRRIWLKGRDKVMFHDSQRRVEARELWYALGEDGALGEMAAQGPGFVDGSTGVPPRMWKVRWENRAEVRRIDGTPVLSFDAHVDFALADAGTFRADRLHVYLKEAARPDGSGKLRVELDRMHATGRVVVDSRQLAGEVGEAQVWFRPPSPSSPEGAPVPARADEGASGSPPLLASAVPWNSPPAPSAASPKKFQLRAGLLKALVVLDKQPIADRLELRDQVELQEITAGEPEPVIVRGDSFELQDGATPTPRGALLGRPADIVARGLQTRGERIHVYPGNNRLQIQGAGEMLFRGRPDARNSAVSDPARIAWQQQMEFDGQVATFDGDVAVHTSRTLRDGQARVVALGERLIVQLTRRVSFRDPRINDSAPSVELAEFAFDGWGFLEVECVDHAGQRTLDQQMQVRQLAVNHVSGEISGEGPGWLRGTHRGRDVRLAPQEQPAAGSPLSGLNFLRVDFQRTLTGNLHRRQLEFLQGTKTLYGPVPGWDSALDQLPEQQLPAEAVFLTCERLAVAQPGDPQNTEDIELEATGNAYVQGQAFSATAGRISYARAKDQLILEGDGRNHATITYHPRPGMQPSHASANKMLFWLSTRQCQVIGLQPSEVNNIGQLRGIRPPAALPR